MSNVSPNSEIPPSTHNEHVHQMTKVLCFHQGSRKLNDSVLPDSCKALINMLVDNKRKLFNQLLKINKDVDEVRDTEETVFTTSHGVKICVLSLTYSRRTKLFTLAATPLYWQDPLTFTPKRPRCFHFRTESERLRTAYFDFFTRAENLRYCQHCGNIANSAYFYESKQMCEVCIYEEATSSLKPESELRACTICLEESKRLCRTNCGHYFHRPCLSKINPDSHGILRCPLCRAPLDPDFEDYHPEHNHGGDDISDSDEVM